MMATHQRRKRCLCIAAILATIVVTVTIVSVVCAVLALWRMDQQDWRMTARMSRGINLANVNYFWLIQTGMSNLILTNVLNFFLWSSSTTCIILHLEYNLWFTIITKDKFQWENAFTLHLQNNTCDGEYFSSSVEWQWVLFQRWLSVGMHWHYLWDS